VNIWNDDAYRVYGQNFKVQVNSGNVTEEDKLDKESFLKGVLSEESINGYVFGDLGPVYGTQWRKWVSPSWDWSGLRTVKIDQVKKLVHNLKNNPSSRRHILSAWNVGEIESMGLPPCHVMSQYTINTKGELWCHMYQRSCDMFLGVPFNVASYSLFTHMLAQVCGLKPGGLIHTMHDTHCYVSHIPAIKEQLQREPHPFPKLELNPDIKDIDDFKFEDIKIVDYKCHPKIKADLVT